MAPPDQAQVHCPHLPLWDYLDCLVPVCICSSYLVLLLFLISVLTGYLQEEGA